MRTAIHLSESQIKEAIKKVLTEWQNGGSINENEDNTTYSLLTDISIKLDMLEKSGFIPFSSPSPSSTELQLKNCILYAHRYIDEAAKLCKSLGYNE